MGTEPQVQHPQYHDLNTIDFYVFSLTDKIQHKIMREEKQVSINLKNINFINIAEQFEDGKRSRSFRPHSSLDAAPPSAHDAASLPRLSRDPETSKDSNRTPDKDKEKDKDKNRDIQIEQQQERPIYEQEYFQKHVYMMREKMLEMFQQSDTIPMKDKKMMEAELHAELKELRETFRSIKAQRKKLYMDNNELHRRIERIHDEAMVFFIASICSQG